MKDIIFTFFNYFVFFYTSMLAISFVTFAFLSFVSLKRRKDYYVESYVRKTIKESPYTPGISVIAPAYNEEKTIIDNVNSMLALEYPLFEVIIVNDGSTDTTLEKMIEYYDLVEVPMLISNESRPSPLEGSSNPKTRNTAGSLLLTKKMAEPRPMLPMQVSMFLPILTLSVRTWTVFWRSMLFIAAFHRSYLQRNRLSQ